MGLGNGAVFKLVPEQFPRETGTVTGLVGALGGLGGFFPPLLLGVFRDRLGAVWPGFVLLSATALLLRYANQRVFHPADVAWRAALPRRRRQAVDRVRAGAWAALVTAAARRGHRRRLAQPRSTSTPPWSATRSRRCSPRSASPTATRCGSSGRRRGCTGGAAGRRSSRAAGSARNVVTLGAARGRRRCRQSLHLPARPCCAASAHWLIMWGCILAAAITFPLVFGWIHFETVPGDLEMLPRVRLRRSRSQDFPIESLVGFLIFHGLVWASFLVIAGVMLAFRRRMRDHGAAAVQQFGEDILPLILLFAISVTGLMLTASYTWMKGYAYDFLAILHAVTVIFTLLWLPFGKFFHIFQRPAQLGVELLQGRRRAQASRRACRRCGDGVRVARCMVRDLIERRSASSGSATRSPSGGGTTSEVCPACRRALFGLAQGSARGNESAASERLMATMPATAESSRFGPHLSVDDRARGCRPASSRTGW